MVTYNQNLVLQANHSGSIFEAACLYSHAGLNVLPLNGKRPRLRLWQHYQRQAVTIQQIIRWQQARLFSNIGLVCGYISQNLVILDLDGLAAYEAFCRCFPSLSETYTVLTGSGVGIHIYWFTTHLPQTTRILSTSIGNLELLAQGHQIVAPPSIHPVTGYAYQTLHAIPIQHVNDLEKVVTWLRSFRPHYPIRTPTKSKTYSGKLNSKMIDAITQRLSWLGYKPRRDWLNGQCVYPNNHLHGDRNPSFGFNTVSGYGYCFVCGTLLAKDICQALYIDVDALGGIWMS